MTFEEGTALALPLGPQLFMGEVTRPAFTNLRGAPADGRVRVIEGVFERA